MKNPLSYFKKEDIEGAITAERENLTFDAKDEDLALAISKAIKESETLKEEKDKEGSVNYAYWKNGSSEDLSKIHPKKSKIRNNRIFMSVETIIPIVTSETPESTVIGSNVDNNTRELLSKALSIAYEVKLSIKPKLQIFVRHWMLYKLGVMKYRWAGGFILENVKAKKIGVDPTATCKKDCEFIWELLEDKASNLIEKFPDKKEYISGKVGGNIESKIKYYEFWGGNGKWVAWKLGEKVLGKIKNPNYIYANAPISPEPTPEAPEGASEEFEGAEGVPASTIPTEGQGEVQPEIQESIPTEETQPKNPNVFKQPEFPYVFMSVLTTGENVYDDVSLIEEAIPLQDGVTQLERQIIDLNEGQKRVWGIGSEAMKLESFQALINKTGDLGVYYDGKTPQGGIQLPLSGKPDASLYNNLTHLINEIDNIMGTHSTTRGEKTSQETLGGKRLMVAADYGRLDMITAGVEQAVEEVYNAYLQCMKVYGLEDETFENGEETVNLNPQDIPAGALVLVKKGSSLPVDLVSKMEQAMGLAKAGMIDPTTLFEEMGYSDPEKRTEALKQWLVAIGKVAPQEEASPEGDERVLRIKALLESPEYKALPPDKQKETLDKAKVALEAIKSGQ